MPIRRTRGGVAARPGRTTSHECDQRDRCIVFCSLEWNDVAGARKCQKNPASKLLGSALISLAELRDRRDSLPGAFMTPTRRLIFALALSGAACSSGAGTDPLG